MEASSESNCMLPEKGAIRAAKQQERHYGDCVNTYAIAAWFVSHHYRLLISNIEKTVIVQIPAKRERSHFWTMVVFPF